MLDNEKELVALAQTGDNIALTKLVKYYTPKIYNLGLRLMRNDKDAEDVLQETFLIMIKKLSSFEGRSTLYTWLYRVATNIALEKLKDKHKTQITASLDDPEYENLGKYEPIELPEFTDEKMSSDQFQKYLHIAMAELNDKLRAVFVLRDIEGNSVSDTARILGLSESNVKVRTMRARLSLRDSLGTILKQEGWS